MEPPQPSQPDTPQAGAPVAPDLTSGTASVEPGIVAPPTTTGSPGVIGRVRGLGDRLFGGGPDVLEPTAQAPDQTPVITAEPRIEPPSSPAIPPTETALQANTGPRPGVEPAGGPFSTDAPPTQSATDPVTSVEPTPPPTTQPDWVRSVPTPWPHIEQTPASAPPLEEVPAEPVATPEPAPTPAIEGVSPEDLQTAAAEDFKRLAGEPERDTREDLSDADVGQLRGLLQRLDPRILGPDVAAEPKIETTPTPTADPTASEQYGPFLTTTPQNPQLEPAGVTPPSPATNQVI